MYTYTVIGIIGTLFEHAAPRVNNWDALRASFSSRQKYSAIDKDKPKTRSYYYTDSDVFWADSVDLADSTDFGAES